MSGALRDSGHPPAPVAANVGNHEGVAAAECEANLRGEYASFAELKAACHACRESCWATRRFRGQPASLRSAPRTTSGSVVVQNGGSEARRKLPYRAVTRRGSRIATTPLSVIVRSSRPAP